MKFKALAAATVLAALQHATASAVLRRSQEEASRRLTTYVTTSEGVTTYLSACGASVPVDPAITVLSPGGDIVSASVTLAAGAPATDTFYMISDTSAPCSWQTQTCGPCPGLNVTIDGASLTIEGVLPAANYERCFRQVTWISLAFGGEEGLGERTVTFSLISTAGDTASAAKTIEVVEKDDTACGDLLNARAFMISRTSDAEPIYHAGCTDCALNFVLVADTLTVFPVGPNPDVTIDRVQYAIVNFNMFPRRGLPPGTFYPEEDKLGIFPDPTDPASTAANPCPGLAISDHLNRDGVVDGYQITTYASTDAYEKCIRRTYYYNTKGTNATLDFRPVGVELGGPLSRTQTFTSILYRMTVDGSDSCSTCAGASPAPSPAASTVPVATVTASVLVIPSSLPSFSNGAASAAPALLALASVVLTAVLAVAL